MRDKVLIFGGTTEGRVLADILRRSGIPHEVSVATEYGRNIEISSGEDNILTGRLSSDEIKKLLTCGEYLLVIDATHPFAVKASSDIKVACDEARVDYLRLSRDTSDIVSNKDLISYVDTMDMAGRELDKTKGNILLLTGSKDLSTIASGISNLDRVYVRVLPSIESIRLCEEAGIRGRHVIAMQGPFSTEMNIALIDECDAKVILTKESGRSGGYYEKIEAADKCGIQVIVVRNPEKKNSEEKILGMKDILDKMAAEYHLPIVCDDRECGNERQSSIGTSDVRTIVIAGIGPGDENYRTLDVQRTLKSADVIFGAESVIGRISEVGAQRVPLYEAGKIIEYLDDHPEFVRPVAVYSGDISLSSGARKAEEKFQEAGYETVKMSGISSVALFANRIGEALEKVHVLSAHGRYCNVTGYARRYEKLIVLPSDAEDAIRICRDVLTVGSNEDFSGDVNEFSIVAGCDLGTDKEEVFLIDFENIRIRAEARVLLFIEHTKLNDIQVIPYLRDEDIIRGNVPMTKEEIRALITRELSLSSGSIFYDIGAGTGSISLEAALLHPEIKVYSYEKNDEALSLLSQNRDKYRLSNMEIIPGEAPSSLIKKVIPSHAFIGGSSKKLKEIIESLVSINPQVRVVLTCVTLETISEITKMADELELYDFKVTQVQVTRYGKRGSYHLADAANPVFIISFGG